VYSCIFPFRPKYNRRFQTVDIAQQKVFGKYLLWTGCDDKIDYLWPEHWLARPFHDALVASCKGGSPEDCGSGGKLLVRLYESSGEWGAGYNAGRKS
jgi:hypothetical protein